MRQGMVTLTNMIQNRPESLENFTILDEKGTIYNIEEFLTKVEKLKNKGDEFRIMKKFIIFRSYKWQR